jgi:hypothetical protein
MLQDRQLTCPVKGCGVWASQTTLICIGLSSCSSNERDEVKKLQACYFSSTEGHSCATRACFPSACCWFRSTQSLATDERVGEVYKTGGHPNRFKLRPLARTFTRPFRTQARRTVFADVHVLWLFAAPRKPHASLGRSREGVASVIAHWKFCRANPIHVIAMPLCDQGLRDHLTLSCPRSL